MGCSARSPEGNSSTCGSAFHRSQAIRIIYSVSVCPWLGESTKTEEPRGASASDRSNSVDGLL